MAFRQVVLVCQYIFDSMAHTHTLAQVRTQTHATRLRPEIHLGRWCLKFKIQKHFANKTISRASVWLVHCALFFAKLTKHFFGQTSASSVAWRYIAEVATSIWWWRGIVFGIWIAFLLAVVCSLALPCQAAPLITHFINFVSLFNSQCSR